MAEGFEATSMPRQAGPKRRRSTVTSSVEPTSTAADARAAATTLRSAPAGQPDKISATCREGSGLAVQGMDQGGTVASGFSILHGHPGLAPYVFSARTCIGGTLCLSDLWLLSVDCTRLRLIWLSISHPSFLGGCQHAQHAHICSLASSSICSLSQHVLSSKHVLPAFNAAACLQLISRGLQVQSTRPSEEVATLCARADFSADALS